MGTIQTASSSQAREEARLVGPHREMALAALERDARARHREVEVRHGVGGHAEHEVDPRGWVS